jgi:hypothetical protein
MQKEILVLCIETTSILIFKATGAVEEEVRIKMVGDHIIDYKLAEAELRKKGLSEERIRELFDRSKYRPHHFEDQTTIQFVKKDIHEMFRHQGAVSDIKHGRSPVNYPE